MYKLIDDKLVRLSTISMMIDGKDTDVYIKELESNATEYIYNLETRLASLKRDIQAKLSEYNTLKAELDTIKQAVPELLVNVGEAVNVDIDKDI